MRQLVFLLLQIVIVAGPARASEWVQLPDPSAYVDMASVRRDKYPKWTEKAQDYIVAWIYGGENGETFTLEAAFDCKGRFGIVQQIIANETKDSRLHSYDSTDFFEKSYPQTKTIPPDLIYDVAASMVCKGKSLSP